MELVSVECPSCAASLPPREPSGQYVCDYCGSRFEARQIKSAKTQFGVQMGPEALAKALAQVHRAAQQRSSEEMAARARRARAASQAAGKLGRRIALLAIVGSLLVTGGVVYTIVSAQKGHALKALSTLSEHVGEVASVSQTVAALGEAVERLGWDDVGGAPIAVTIRGEPAVIGRTRAYGVDNLYIDAYDGTTVERRWRIGDLGTYGEGYQNILYGVLADRVVVSDARGNLSVHELDTGQELRRHSLTDKVVDICVPPDGGGRVWIHQKDERNHLLDVRSGDLAEAKRPKWCSKSRRAGRRAERQAGQKLRKPRIKGTKLTRVVVEGDVAVAAGVKHPGTAVPRAVGFDPESREVRWDQVVPAVDAATVRENSSEWGHLVAGRYVTTYGAGRESWYLTALDGRTGARLWNTKLRSLFAVDRMEGLVVTDERVYLVRTGSLEVFDVENGRLLGTVGTATYDDGDDG